MDCETTVNLAPVGNRCLSCGYGLTWANIRVQYGRAIKRGLTLDEAKAVCPRCQKCMTKFLKKVDIFESEQRAKSS